MSNNTRSSEFSSGVRDTLPMLVGAAPFAIIFGSLTPTAQLAPWQGQLMSLAIFAGSSQFIGVGLMASSVGMLVIWLATFIVNLRHTLYAATLLPHVRHLSFRWRWLLGFLLTDETFAIVNSHYIRNPGNPMAHWYFLGSGMAMYVNWQCWTLIGLIFGAAFPQLQTMGLDYAMVVTFIAIVVPQLTKVPQLAAAITAGAVAYLLRDLPYKLALLAAIGAGVGIGMLLTRTKPRVAQSITNREQA